MDVSKSKLKILTLIDLKKLQKDVNEVIGEIEISPSDKCPHGDYLYRYTKKKDGSLKIELLGEMVLKHEILEEIKKHETEAMRGEIVKDEQGVRFEATKD